MAAVDLNPAINVPTDLMHLEEKVTKYNQWHNGMTATGISVDGEVGFSTNAKLRTSTPAAIITIHQQGRGVVGFFSPYCFGVLQQRRWGPGKQI